MDNKENMDDITVRVFDPSQSITNDDIDNLLEKIKEISNNMGGFHLISFKLVDNQGRVYGAEIGCNCPVSQALVEAASRKTEFQRFYREHQQSSFQDLLTQMGVIPDDETPEVN